MERRALTGKRIVPEFKYIAGCDPYHNGHIPVQLYRIHKSGEMEKIVI